MTKSTDNPEPLGENARPAPRARQEEVGHPHDTRFARELAETGTDLMLEVDRQQRIVWANPAAQRHFGTDLVGRFVHRLFGESALLSARWTAFVAGRAPNVTADAAWHRGLDHRERLLEWHFFRLSESWAKNAGAWLSAVDITASVGTLNRDIAGTRASQLMDTIWELDLQRRPEKTRGELIVALGLAARGSLKGEEWSAHVHPQDLHIFDHFVDDLVRGVDERIVCNFRGRDAGGPYRWFETAGWVSARDGVGMPLRAIGTGSDLTTRDWVEEEQSRREARALQYQKMEAIGELAGGIAHDFNNTLTTIMGYAELALLEVDHARERKLATYLREVYQGGRRARELVSKMMLFSRQEEAHPERVPVRELVESSARILRATLPASVRISIDCAGQLPDLLVDPSMMHLMLINLCVNASDAMQGVGVIYLRARFRERIDQLCASCHDRFAGDMVEFAVEDSGPGIPAEIERRIFEPYMSTKQTGSGMGLAVVHGVVHQQQGHLLVDTLIGDGTEFRLYFPAAPAAIASAADDEEIPLDALQADPANRDRHILVVDDELALRDFLKELLERQGFLVTAAVNGLAAWDVFRTTPDRFDLVLTDQAMPGITGVELTERIRALRPGLPVVLCTGFSEVVSEETAGGFGLAGYVAKPVDTRKLLEIVDRTLRSTRPH